MRERTRHGSFVWYFRKGKTERVRIRGDFGSAEFIQAYHDALNGDAKKQSSKNTPNYGTLSWLIAQYRQSQEWLRFSQATKKQRENIFLAVIQTAGAERYADITKKTIKSAYDRRSDKPFAAANFMKSMRGLFNWAHENDYMDVNPTQGIKVVVPKTDGFLIWSEEEVRRFETFWSEGTRERLALNIFLYTGFRRGDAALLSARNIINDTIQIKTGKGGRDIAIPLLAPLKEAISSLDPSRVAFIVDERTGKPMTKESVGNWFGDACRKAGVNKSAHGLRKVGATRAAEAGATMSQLMAIFGWSNPKTAMIYIEKANRKKMAKDATHMLMQERI